MATNKKNERKTAKHQVTKISFLVSLSRTRTDTSGYLIIRRRSNDTAANETSCIVSKRTVSRALELHNKFCEA